VGASVDPAQADPAGLRERVLQLYGAAAA
jgi:hypothetical protein